MRRISCTILALVMVPLLCNAQVDRREVRSGNRDFRKDRVKEAEIDYRKAVLKDSTSFAAQYNLASVLYRSNDFEGASKALEALKESGPSRYCAPSVKGEDMSADYYYNLGDVALQKKDYAAAVSAFRSALLITPSDLDAKENYIYAKKMLDNQQGGGGGQNNDQNQDQNQDDQQNNDQNDNQDQQNQDQQNQNQDQQDQEQQAQDQKISRQQAQQMLKAIQAKEKETQDKVNKEKAALLQSKQKDKNW